MIATGTAEAARGDADATSGSPGAEPVETAVATVDASGWVELSCVACQRLV
jgi:hypothetical protein